MSAWAGQDSAVAGFRWGVAALRVAEASGDAELRQRAVDAFLAALARDPGHYIWRRRLQQYGPRLDKPYSFYAWVEQARREIQERGEEPLVLDPEPAGSEIAAPRREPGGVRPPPAGDPTTWPPLAAGDARVKVLTVPRRVAPGGRCRVRVQLSLSRSKELTWNEEGPGLRLRARWPNGFGLVEGRWEEPSAARGAERSFDFEIAVPSGAEAGDRELPVTLLYETCRKGDGVCEARRAAFAIPLRIEATAPRLGRSRRSR